MKLPGFILSFFTTGRKRLSLLYVSSLFWLGKMTKTDFVLYNRLDAIFFGCSNGQ